MSIFEEYRALNEADDNLFFFFNYFSDEIRLDISYESSARRVVTIYSVKNNCTSVQKIVLFFCFAAAISSFHDNISFIETIRDS